MLESPAFRALSLSARRILDLLEIELHAGHGGSSFENARGLPLTYDQIVRFGVDRHAIGPAIRELVALGFVEVIRKGCAGNAYERQSALYRLTYQFSGSNYALTDEWRRFKTTEEVEVARKDREAKARPARVRKNKSPVGESHTGPGGGNPHCTSGGTQHWNLGSAQWGKPTLL
jgi:hypothetical protein